MANYVLLKWIKCCTLDHNFPQSFASETSNPGHQETLGWHGKFQQLLKEANQLLVAKATNCINSHPS